MFYSYGSAIQKKHLLIYADTFHSMNDKFDVLCIPYSARYTLKDGAGWIEWLTRLTEGSRL